MNNPDCKSEDRSVTFSPFCGKARNGARILGLSVVFGLTAVGCEGGSINIAVPEISASVPALPDDSAVDNMQTGVNTTAAGDQLVLSDEEQQSELPEVPVLPAEGPSGDAQLDDVLVEVETQLVPDSEVEADPPQVIELETVAAVATNVGISARSQDLLSSALSRGGVRIMPTGDSITHGIGGSTSYRPELADLLDAAGCSYRMVGSQSQSLTDTGYYGAHEGYSGHSADNFLTGNQTNSGSNPGIANAVNYQSPDLVLLHLGSVDLFKGQTVESTVNEIATVIDTIHQNKPDTVVVVANVIPWFNDSQDANLPNAIRTLGNRIQQLIQSSGNPLVSIADVRSGFTEDMMQSDMIHPNPDGDRHIANAIFESFYTESICS